MGTGKQAKETQDAVFKTAVKTETFEKRRPYFSGNGTSSMNRAAGRQS
jgi:hypothetical protein